MTKIVPFIEAVDKLRNLCLFRYVITIFSSCKFRGTQRIVSERISVRKTCNRLKFSVREMSGNSVREMSNKFGKTTVPLEKPNR